MSALRDDERRLSFVPRCSPFSMLGLVETGFHRTTRTLDSFTAVHRLRHPGLAEGSATSARITLRRSLNLATADTAH